MFEQKKRWPPKRKFTKARYKKNRKARPRGDTQKDAPRNLQPWQPRLLKQCLPLANIICKGHIGRPKMNEISQVWCSKLQHLFPSQALHKSCLSNIFLQGPRLKLRELCSLVRTRFSCQQQLALLDATSTRPFSLEIGKHQRNESCSTLLDRCKKSPRIQILDCTLAQTTAFPRTATSSPDMRQCGLLKAILLISSGSSKKVKQTNDSLWPLGSEKEPLVAFLFLVAMPGAPSSFFLLILYLSHPLLFFLSPLLPLFLDSVLQVALPQGWHWGSLSPLVADSSAMRHIP